MSYNLYAALFIINLLSSLSIRCFVWLASAYQTVLFSCFSPRDNSLYTHIVPNAYALLLQLRSSFNPWQRFYLDKLLGDVPTSLYLTIRLKDVERG